MKLEILQGLNYISRFSVVKIECDTNPDTRILDLLKSYHSIFFEKYTVDGNTLIIETNLPRLWEECAEKINKISIGKLNYEDGKDFILEKIVKGQIYSMSTIPILESAFKMGLEVNQFLLNTGLELSENGNPSQWNRYYRIGSGRMSGITTSSGSSKDPIVAKKVQRDKKITNTLVSTMELIQAKWDVIISVEDLKQKFEQYPKPVVIKPTGLTQGHGVTTNIFDLDHAKRAYYYAVKIVNNKNRAEWQKQIMIQQQVKGDDYRLLIINGKLEIATKRVPAFVTGDGKSTIKELIDETNKDPRRDMQNPVHTLKPIVFDEPLDEFLAEQKLSLDYVPKVDDIVKVRKVASMSQGGITEDFTEEVHPQIKYLAESLASSIHANVVGIDVICLDISKPLTLDNGSFIEMNTMPETYLNAFPVIGKEYPDIGEKIIKGVLKDCEPINKVVVVGGNIEKVNKYLENSGYYKDGNYTGLLFNNEIFVNKEKVSSEIDSKIHAFQAIKSNALLSNIVIHFNDFSDVEKYGFGFDNYNLLVWLKDESQEISSINNNIPEYIKELIAKKLIKNFETPTI